MSGVFNIDVSVLGQCLTTPQRIATKNALYKLQINSKLPGTLTFWGKITTTTATDYLIAAHTTLQPRIERSYFYSVDGGAGWAVLPGCDEWAAGVAGRVGGLFVGNPALKLRDPSRPVKRNEEGEVVEDEEEEEGEDENEGGEDKTEDVVKKPKERRLTEEERLAYTVALIDHECAIQPTGLTLLTPAGHIATDPAFAGLTPHQLPLLASYSHLRNPTTPAALARQRKQRTANCTQYLDRLGEGSVEAGGGGGWVVSVGEGGLEVGLRSVVWLGWEYRIRVGEREGRGAYFGFGERNNDLHFML